VTKTNAKMKAQIAICAGLTLSVCAASALPEDQLATRNNGMIIQEILKNPDIYALREQLSKTGVPVLDTLWDARVDLTSGACNATSNNCRVISVFRGAINDKPVVLFEGFTGYRKMYLEQIQDLLDAGYGPVLISDLSGNGDSFKPELKPGEGQRWAGDYIAKFITGQNDLKSAVTTQAAKLVSAEQIPTLTSVLKLIPVGVGYIPTFDYYIQDVDLIMNTAVRDNPDHKILMISLSQSGLNVVEALANQNEKPTWISHVDRIVLESPMIHVQKTSLGTQIATTLGQNVSPSEAIAMTSGIPSFVTHALGTFDPKSAISHSPTRLTMTDAVRLWNGKDTWGVTLGWAAAESARQYEPNAFLAGLNPNALNGKVGRIAKALDANSVTLVVAVSDGDGIVDTPVTKTFVADLARNGYRKANLCVFKTADHVMDQESDKYRVPYMSMVIDQKDAILKSVYGTTPDQEQLVCNPVQ
jgi:alpha-beta hydrolase superfamily lysophospholipase